MNEHNTSLPSAPTEPEAAALLRKIQQQIASLEKKIDILISQSQTMPFKKNQFSKPFRPFGQHHRFDRESDSASGEKHFNHGRHFEKGRFEKGHGEKDRGFGYKKKSYGHSSESYSGPGHNFKKRHSGEKRGFDQKNKPFYYRRKDRTQ